LVKCSNEQTPKVYGSEEIFRRKSPGERERSLVYVSFVDKIYSDVSPSLEDMRSQCMEGCKFKCRVSLQFYFRVL